MHGDDTPACMCGVDCLITAYSSPWILVHDEFADRNSTSPVELPKRGMNNCRFSNKNWVISRTSSCGFLFIMRSALGRAVQGCLKMVTLTRQKTVDQERSEKETRNAFTFLKHANSCACNSCDWADDRRVFLHFLSADWWDSWLWGQRVCVHLLRICLEWCHDVKKVLFAKWHPVVSDTFWNWSLFKWITCSLKLELMNSPSNLQA